MLKNLTFFSLLLVLLSQKSGAAIIYSAAPGGNWNQGTSWVGGNVPTANDTVNIVGGSNIVITANASIKRIRFLADTASNSVTLASGISFSVEELLFGIPTRDNRQFLFNVDAGSATIAKVMYDNPSGDTRRCILRVGDGSLLITGSLDMNPADYAFTRRRIEITGTGSVNFQGPIAYRATLTTSPGSTVTYSSSASYPLFTTDYHNLIVAGAGIKTLGSATINGKAKFSGGGELSLSGDLTFKDSLILNEAIITQNNSNVALSGNFSLAGNFGSSSHINQNGTGFLRIVGDSAERFLQTFPVGTNGKYSPVTITRLAANFPGGTGNRNLEIKSFGMRHPVTSGTDNAAKRFWRIRSNNITVVTKFGITFGYADADVEAPIVESSLTSTARLRGTGWQVDFTGGSVSASTNQLVVDSTNNVIDADYTFGQAAAFPASFPYAFTVKNGNWSTAGNWSTGTVPTAGTDVLVLHNITGFDGSANNVTVSQAGYLTASNSNATINGTLTVAGQFNDSHSGGVNLILGKVTVEAGASFTGSGSGSGTNFVFANDIENNGTWNVLSSYIRFSRQVKNVLKISGSQPVNFLRAGSTLVSQVDTLIFAQNVTALNPSRIEPNFFVGDTSLPFNCVVWNKSAVTFSSLSSRPTTGFTRKFIQGNNSYLGIDNGVPFTGATGILEATAQGNTVDYRQGSSQTILPVDYYHLELTGDRYDRFKTLAPGADVTVFGDVTVKSNSATFQFSPNSNGQKLTIKGNLVLEGNGNFRTASGGKVQNQLEIGGKIINNSNLPFGINGKVTDTTFTTVTLNGTGVVAQGYGNARLRNLILAGTDTMKWEGTGITEMGDTLWNNSAGFIQKKGNFYIPTGARVTLKGTSGFTKIRRITVTDRGDRFVAVSQKLNLEVDSLFHLQTDGRTSIGASYDFSGYSLKVKGEFRVGSNGGNSALRGDSLSTLEISGSDPTSSLLMQTGYRKLGVLVHDKSANPLTVSSPLAVYKRLDLQNGILNGSGSIRMVAGSTVRRSGGSVQAAFNNTSGKYNLEYLKALTSGPEAMAVPALGKLTIAAPAGDTVTFANSPSLDSNLVYVSGKMKSGGTGYVKLNPSSWVEMAAPSDQVIFPVGTPATPSFIVAIVGTISSGKLLLKPYKAEAANIPGAANVRLSRYVEVGGNAAGLAYGVGLNYLDADVTGGPESFLEPQFWNGTSWSTATGVINPALNAVGFTTLTEKGIVTAFGTSVSVDPRTGKETISVFPNPSKGLVRIQTSANVELLGVKDLLGKEVAVKTSKTSFGFELDLETLPKGLYFVSLAEGNTRQILRIVKD